MDTKFSSAIHMLILISESDKPMNSEQIATSVGTNASYIRKLSTRLSKAGIISANRGISGFTLSKKSEEKGKTEGFIWKAEKITGVSIAKRRSFW